MPKYLPELQAAGSDFHVFDIRNLLPENKIYVVYRKDYPQPRHVLAFVNVITRLTPRFDHLLDDLY